MARTKVAQGQSRSKQAEGAAAASAEKQLESIRRELHGVAYSLGTALGDIVEAYTQEDHQSFALALRKVNSARVVLEFEAAKLAEVRS